ncbi:sugar ABC transporter substrate-binding protein [Myceligenerans indicum]|uniref:Sugar ABC transporter substrate-binding protein n=1 Tax=Myceligenerans indicum TaxID=2593663 RepID=A0ABS1LI73_9MICO|nr:substrate-binding domain-containing protein [Myceligenerans indicum]MBL0885921.1 sugar ABC transporter substrate-binding protein [Myceligenerans indicum]
MRTPMGRPGPRLITGLASLALLAGCSSADGSAATANSDESQSAAQELIDPYLGQPGEFPVTEPLDAPVPAGTRIAYVDNGNALVALMYQLMQPAAEELGIELYAVRAGTSASGVQSAFSTVVQQQPDAVINTAIDPVLWDNQREQLIDAGIPIVSLGTVADPDAGLVQPNGVAAFERQGRLQAAWLVAGHDESVDAVLYEHSEIAYAEAVQEGFESELAELCPDCTVRVVQIPIAEVGNKAPERIVSDLQSHPETDAVVFQSSAVATGLPAKLKVAGMDDIEIVGANPLPTNLQYLKDGQSTVELGADLNTLAWTAVDTAARLVNGQDLQENVADGEALVHQFLRPEDVTFDPAHGFAGYPDVADRFRELWNR